MRSIGVLLIVLLGVSSGGCSASSGFLRDDRSQYRSEYRLELQSQKFLRTVSGSATTFYILCPLPLSVPLAIGGLIPISGQPYKRAMDRLYTEAQLQPNQVVLNLREDVDSISYLGLACSSTLTMSGDVFEMSPKGEKR